MVFVKLSSTNPKFGFIIFKNPSSGMQLRDIRKGNGYGYYSVQEGKVNPQEFNVHFHDSDSDVSYKQGKDDAFEYVNVSRYNSSACVYNCISEFFKSTLTKHSDDDIEGFQNKFTVTMNRFNPNKSICKSLLDCGFNVSIKHEMSRSYKIEITTEQPLHKLLTFCDVFFMLNSISNREMFEINKGSIEKIVNQVSDLDLNYYIRYFLSSNVIFPSVFPSVKSKLEESERYSLSLQCGDTHIQRKSFLDTVVFTDRTIIDIGCGSGFHAIPYAKKLGSKPYIAIDQDENELERLVGKAKHKNIQNITTYKSTDEFFNSSYALEPVNVLITEMLEHVEKEEAVKLLGRVYGLDFNRIVITVPNGRFNKNYPMKNGEMRHHDHKWEPTREEFVSLVSSTDTKKVLNYKYYPVGDIVDGESVSHGMVIELLLNDVTPYTE